MKWLALAFAVLVVLAVAAFAAVRWQLSHVETVELVSVTTTYPGASAQEVERAVTEPLEAAVSQVKGVEEVRSSSDEGLSFLFVRVRGVGVEAVPAAMLVREALEPVLKQLPQAATPPAVSRLGLPGEVKHRRFALSSDRWSPVELRRWADDVARRELEVKQGVRLIELCGGLEDEVEVRLDATRLQASGLSALAVTEVLERENLAVPAGRLEQAGRGFTVRTLAGFESVDSLGRTVLKQDPVVRLNDVAQVSRHGARPSCDAQFRGQPVVLLDVSVEPAAAATLPLPTGPAGLKVEEVSDALHVSQWLLPGLSERDLLAASRVDGAELLVRYGNQLRVFTTGLPLVPPPGLALAANEGGAVVQVFCADLSLGREVAAKARERLTTAWVGALQPAPGEPELVVKQDRERAALLGVSSFDVAQTVRAATIGIDVGELSTNGQRVPVRVKLDAKLEDGTVRLPNGVALTDVVTLERAEGVAEVRRVNRQRVIEFASGLDVDAVHRALEGLPLPAGVSIQVAPNSDPLAR